MRNKIRRKILALLCTAAMLIGIFPIGLQAEGASPDSNLVITIQSLGKNEFNKQEAVTINWSVNTTTDTAVKIELLQDEQSVQVILGSSLTLSGHGIFTWTVPDYRSYGENYKIRITSLENSQVKADSLPFSITPGNWSNFTSGSLTGSGTETTPYEIKTAEDLALVAKQVNAGTSSSGAYFKLMNNIDLSAHYWTPIGVNSSHFFEGVFDGNNYEISGMTIGSEEQPAAYDYVGLFGVLNVNGSVINTKVSNAAVYGDTSYVGALLGYNAAGNVSGCYTTGHVGVSIGSFGGGIVGDNEGNISNCGTECSVSGGKGSIIGGFAGNIGGVVQNCYAIGDVSGGDDGGAGHPCGVGGFVGMTQADILNCYAAGSVSGGMDALVGGFAGIKDATFKNINVYWNGSAEQKVNGQIRQDTDLLGAGYVLDDKSDTSCRLSQEVMQGSTGGSNVTYTYNTAGDTAVTGDTKEAFVQALNRGIGALETGKTYWIWKADTSHVNKGYPILTSPSESSLPNTYGVAVQNDGNGTGVASPSLSEASETVKLSAMPNSSYVFKEWQVISPVGLVIKDDEFIMPSEEVTVKAIFEEGWTVTFKNNGADYSTQTVRKGETIGSANWPVNPTQTGYIFDGWYTGTDGAGVKFTASTIVNNTTTLYAKWIPEKYTVTVQNDGNGTGTASPSVTEAGETVKLSAVPNSGYFFKEWKVISPVGLVITGDEFIMPSEAVIVKAIFEEGVTVSFKNNGADYSTQTVRKGEKIGSANWPVNPTQTGYIFDGWYTAPDGVGVQFTASTAVNNNTTLYAKWTPAAPATYALTITAGTGGSITSGLSGNYTKDSVINITAVPNSGYQFSDWTTSHGGTFTDAHSSHTTFTMPENAVTITARFTYIGNGGGDSGGGGSSSSSVSSPTVEPVIPIIVHQEINQPIEAEFILKTSVGQNADVVAVIPETAITEAIRKAQATQKEHSVSSSFGTKVSLDVPSHSASLKVVLTQAALKKLVEAQTEYFEINGIRISLNFSLEELKEIQKQAEGDITITVTPVENLSEEATALIGKRPAYNVSITYRKNGQSEPITVLPESPIFVRIPYMPVAGEYTENLRAAYIDDQGKVSLIQGSYYDEANQCIVWPAHHFSVYGVAYQSPITKFTDVTNHWAKESIDYVVSKGILPGTSESTFSPSEVVTRGMLVTALGRQQGIDRESYTTSSFKDVKAGSSSLPYIEWAYKMGVVSGRGNKQFAPDVPVSREELAAILVAYGKKTEGLSKAGVTDVKSIVFADSDRISSWAKASVKAIQQLGLMGGDQQGKFNPKASTTRAEIASILYRYAKLTADTETLEIN